MGKNKLSNIEYLSAENISPDAFYEFNVKSITKKANKYKKWSRYTTILLATSSGFIPLFVGVFDNWIFAKLIPSGLAAVSVIVASFIQLEKPQERWKLYRRFQRRLEEEWLYYKSNSNQYGTPEGRDELFIKNIQKILINLHERWEGLIPEVSEVSSSIAQAKGGKTNL